MNTTYLNLIKKYINIFVSTIGFAYLTQEMFNWFNDDSPILIAAINTFALIMAKLIDLLIIKIKSLKNMNDI